MSSAKSADVAFEGINPILRVDNITTSVNYYVRVLGFKLDWGGSFFASVSRGKCHIFLSCGDQGRSGGWVWIGVGDVDALLKEYQGSGAKIRHAPTNYPWAYEMQVEDIDGNVLRIGSEAKSNEPIGEWLDMLGQRWLPLPEGGWKPAK